MEQLPVLSILLVLLLIPFLVELLALSTSTAGAAPAATASTLSSGLGVRLELTHVDAGRGLRKADLLNRAALRSKKRAASLSKTSTTVLPSEGEYLLELAIGTPPLHYTAILDTGSDLIWTQCKTCKNCIPQPSPLFDPLASASFSRLPCSSNYCHALDQFACTPDCFYFYQYGDNTVSQGLLGRETLTLGSTKNVLIPHIVFGCGIFNGGNIQNSSGIVGFGRGLWSLNSQLGLDKFSYCFTPYDDDSKKSSLLFGSQASLNPSKGVTIKSTPLIRNPSNPTFYYVDLNGITLGTTRLPIPYSAFKLNKEGTGGTVIDSGTQLIILSQGAYKAVLEAFSSQLKLPFVNGSTQGIIGSVKGLSDVDVCFSSPSEPKKVPKMILHFQGADLELLRDNYVRYIPQKHLLCALVLNGEDSTILGSVVTQNMKVLYDLKNDMISFMPAQCDHL